MDAVEINETGLNSLQQRDFYPDQCVALTSRCWIIDCRDMNMPRRLHTGCFVTAERSMV